MFKQPAGPTRTKTSKMTDVHVFACIWCFKYRVCGYKWRNLSLAGHCPRTDPNLPTVVVDALISKNGIAKGCKLSNNVNILMAVPTNTTENLAHAHDICNHA